MSGLDYSQKRLLSRALKSHKTDAYTRRLQVYAVLTGFFSMIISFATLLIWIFK